MTRRYRHDREPVWIYVRDANGREVWRKDSAGVVGSPTLTRMHLAGMTRGLGDGETLDTTELVEAERVLAEKRRQCIEALGIIIPGPGDLAAELAKTDRTVLVTPPQQPYERVVVEHRDLTDPPTPPPDWAKA